MDLERLAALLDKGKSHAVEFKSNQQPVPDKVVYEEVIALANAAGETLLPGVEDDGRVTEALPRHGTSTEPVKLQVAILNNTVLMSIRASAWWITRTGRLLRLR